MSSAACDFVRVDRLSKHYPHGHGRHVVRSVDKVSFSIRRGETLGLVGESGCGKSTLARVILGLVPATSGSVRIDRHEVTQLRGESLRRVRRHMQMVFQDPFSAFDPRMRVGASLVAPLREHRLGSRGECESRARTMLRQVGLDDERFFDRYPAECSGGQLQRVGIGRALLLEPRFLICDEPTSALDASIRAQVLRLLAELRGRLGLTLLMITHDLRLAARFCDRVAVMYLGQLVELASSEELFSAPQHPYTRALIASSMLERHGFSDTGDALIGEPPSPITPPAGCRLCSRCRHADGCCSGEAPELLPSDPEILHLVRCHHTQRITPWAIPS